MLKRAILSITNQKLKSLLLGVVTTILFTSFSTIFIMNAFASNIHDSLDSSINPKTAFYSDLVIKDSNDYAWKTNLGSANDVKVFYKDLERLYQNNSTNNYEINVLTNGFIFLLPQYDDHLLIQSFSVDTNHIENENSLYRIKSGNTISGGSFYRLSSANSKNINQLILNEDVELIGRSFTDEELDSQERVIVLCQNTYYYVDDSREPHLINVGDTITYNLYVDEGDSRVVAKSYDFKVIGIIIKGGEENIYGYNFIPEKTYHSIISDLYPLISHNEEIFSFLPSTAKFNYIDDLFSFNQDVLDLNREDYFFISDAEEYSALYGEIMSVATSFNLMLILAFIAITLTLFFILNLEINQRRKEIGIWLSLGESKRRIALSFLAQYLFIFIISVLLSLFISIILLENYVVLIFDLSYIGEFNLVVTDYFNVKDVIELILVSIVTLIIVLASSFYKISHLSIKELIVNE